MPDEPVTSAPGGGAPAGGGGAAPAAPTSSAPAAPATPSTPTPAATETPSTPATPAVPAPITRNPGESEDQFLARYREQQKAEAVKTGDEKPAEPAKPAEEAKPVEAAKPAEEVKPPEEKKPEPVAEAPKPAESKLAETIFSNEKLAAALEEAGLKDELAEELRTAAVGREYSEIFPDVETAQFARQQAEAFTAADLAASNLKMGDMGSTRDFVQNVLMPMSYILKEDGTPEMIEVDGANGQKIQVPRTDGTVDVLLSNLGDLYVDRAMYDANQMLKFAEANPNDSRSEALKERAENVLAAADILRGHHKGKEPEPENMTPEMKAERARLDADKQALAEQKSREATERFTKFRNDLVAESDKTLDTLIEGWLDQTSLAPNPADSEQTKKSKEAMRISVRQQTRDGLYTKLNADQLFIGEQEQKGRRGAGALKDLANTYRRYAEKYIYSVATPILNNFGHERVRQSQARSTKIAAQQDATSKEARAGVAPAKPKTQTIDERQIMREVTEDLTKQLKRPPNMDEQVAEWRKRVNAAKAKSVAAV